MATNSDAPAADRHLHSWAACIATLNRHEVLMVALTHVLRQTRPPAEIVVVDASEDWEAGRDRAATLLSDRPDIALTYGTSEIRSSAVQRNVAIARATADVVVMIDDDSFLHDDFGERLLAVFDADANGAVAGVGGVIVDDRPRADDGAAQGLQQKATGKRGLSGIYSAAMRTRLGRWLNREVLMQSAERLFLRYDEPRLRQVPAAIAHLDVTPSVFMPGCGMGYRRAMGQREPFDSALRYYAAFEDLDVAYRIGRHGALIRANDARFFHFEAAGGRIKRKKVIAFQLLNMVIFLKRNAADPASFRGRYRVLVARRFLSEFLKDILSRRWRFPQLMGVLVAARNAREVWAGDAATIDAWYPEFQRRILEDIK